MLSINYRKKNPNGGDKTCSGFKKIRFWILSHSIGNSEFKNLIRLIYARVAALNLDLSTFSCKFSWLLFLYLFNNFMTVFFKLFKNRLSRQCNWCLGASFSKQNYSREIVYNCLIKFESVDKSPL